MRLTLCTLAIVMAAIVALLPAPPGGSGGAHGGHDGGPAAWWAPARAALAQAGSYQYTFDGQPAGPQQFLPAGWDVVVNVSDGYRGDGVGIASMQAHHGPDCGAPPATHPISRTDQAVFLCRDHLMTAMNEGYGAVYLTPNQQVDFSSGEAVVRFDMSTLRSVGRDWVDLWITPYEDNLLTPLEDWGPAYQGEPKRAVHVRMDGSSAGTIFKGAVVRNHAAAAIRSGEWRGYERVLTPDSVRRDTFELRISRTRVKFGMPAYNLWWVDNAVADLGWSRGVVQLGHHAYNPVKGCDEDGNEADEEGRCANTWHWDNVSIAPAVPFGMTRGAPRLVKASISNGQVTFPAAAPANAHLRFSAVGANLQVSFNNGASWQAARKQPQEKDKAEHWSSYFTPMPAGATGARFRGDATYAGPWAVQDASIWSTGAGGAPR